MATLRLTVPDAQFEAMSAAAVASGKDMHTWAVEVLRLAAEPAVVSTDVELVEYIAPVAEIEEVGNGLAGKRSPKRADRNPE